MFIKLGAVVSLGLGSRQVNFNRPLLGEFVVAGLLAETAYPWQ